MLQSNVAKEINEFTRALRNMCVAVPSTLPDMLKASFFLSVSIAYRNVFSIEESAGSLHAKLKFRFESMRYKPERLLELINQ